jgi:hypothetical protein
MKMEFMRKILIWRRKMKTVKLKNHKYKVQKYEEQMKDSMINTVLILELHMINKFLGNNNRSQEFGM